MTIKEEQDAEGASEAGSNQEDELELQLKEILQQNEALQRENQLLSQHLRRVFPTQMDQETEQENSTIPKKKNRHKREEKQEVTISVDDKLDMTQMEIEYLQDSFGQIKQDHDQVVDNLKASIDELDCRIADTKRDTYELKRDIILGGQCPRTGKINADKVVKFMELHIAHKDSMTQKYKAKWQSVRQQLARLESQSAQKEEMGEVLHVVDFDQLKIENQQYLEKIEAKNAELLKLKLTTGKTVQVLNHLKSELQRLVERGQLLQKEINDREVQMERFDDDFNQSVHERDEVKQGLRRLKLEQEDVDQPQILDYIRIKADVLELQNKQLDWKRKIEITDLDIQRTYAILKSSKMQQMDQQLTPA